MDLSGISEDQFVDALGDAHTLVEFRAMMLTEHDVKIPTALSKEDALRHGYRMLRGTPTREAVSGDVAGNRGEAPSAAQHAPPSATPADGAPIARVRARRVTGRHRGGQFWSREWTDVSSVHPDVAADPWIEVRYL